MNRVSRNIWIRGLKKDDVLLWRGKLYNVELLRECDKTYCALLGNDALFNECDNFRIKVRRGKLEHLVICCRDIKKENIV